MDIALVIVAVTALAISMACLGYFAAIRQQTLDDLQARKELRDEFTGVLAKVVGEHNKLVGQIVDTADRISAVDMKVSGVAGRPASPLAGMGRKP